MNTEADRIKQIREFTGLNQKDFGASIGLKQGAYSPIENPKNNRTLSARALKSISKKYKKIDLHWLITGEGEMLKQINIGNSTLKNVTIGSNNNNNNMSSDPLINNHEIRLHDLELEIKLLKKMILKD